MRSALLVERAVRGTVVLREGLAFDTRFAAAAAGKPEAVGHVFLLLDGRFVWEGGTHAAPVGFVLADDEIERVGPKAKTFRTDGPRATVIQLRIAKRLLPWQVGMTNGPITLAAETWAAARALTEQPTESRALATLLKALGVPIEITLEEPERLRRLWNAIEPLYAQYGARTSIKQLAGALGHVDAAGRPRCEGAGLDVRPRRRYRDALLLLRLRSAALLLSAADATVAEVARLVGYGSPIAMARAFRDAKLPAPSVGAGRAAQIDCDRPVDARWIAMHVSTYSGVVVRAVLVLLLLEAVARAGGFGIPEIGVRRTAMGAVIGRPDDGSSLYHNPAGLVLEDGWRIYVSRGLSLLDTQFELRPWDQSDRVPRRAAPDADGYYAPVKPSRAFGVIPMIAVTGHVADKRVRRAARCSSATRPARRSTRTRSRATT